MKFPFRLSLDLWKSKAARGFGAVREGSLIRHLALSEFADPSAQDIEAESDPRAGLMKIPVNVLAQTSAPVLWIGGKEPLDHPVIGRITTALTAAGRNVFVHTNGVKLRRRIHEFRPDQRLFLTLELGGREELHDQIAMKAGAFCQATEAIRTAKLSGFHVCAHVTVGTQTEPCRMGELFDSLDRHDVDGFIVSSGDAAKNGAASTEVTEKLEEVRSLVRCSRWEGFSRLLEESYQMKAAKARPTVAIGSSEAGACEESV